MTKLLPQYDKQKKTIVHSCLFFCDERSSSKRVDLFLAEECPKCSRTYFQWLISQGLVLVNGQKIKKGIRLSSGDEIDVQFINAPELSLDPEDIPLDILYEDEHFLAINKPAGLVVHPGPGNWSHTFVNALLFHCKELPKNDALRPGIVHRLDKETTGVLIAAKTLHAHAELSRMFSLRLVKKTYHAVAVGVPKQLEIVAPIGRHPINRKLMTVVSEGGKNAHTNLKILGTHGKLSTLEIDLQTGRTHQIRVHLQHIGTPVLGDAVYGIESINNQLGISRQLLHASSLVFCHPITGEKKEIIAPFPEDMATFFSNHKKKYSEIATP
jgi:23S rRNA pseudouridine1911/1915/1917 synthase